VYAWEYDLKTREPLNARSSRVVHRGALLRMGDGFACVHPWPELGDAPLEAQLRLLREGEETPLLRRAAICAAADGEARRSGRSLFEGLAIPPSHALVTGMETAGDLLREGFRKFKMKCGGKPAMEIQRVRKLCAELESVPESRLRLDFNESMSAESFREFCRGAGEETIALIEFAEDPFPYDGDTWHGVQAETGVAFAVDRSAELASAGFRFLVIKPALHEADDLVIRAREKTVRVVFTSYMDHPVGQMYAAYEAARAFELMPDAVDTCGLVTHRLFEGDDFCQSIESQGPNLESPRGTGLGFDELLESLPWKKLN